MKKILGLIAIIILFAYAPIQSIWPVDYSSKTASIIIFLSNLQVIILASLHSLISIIVPIVLNLLVIIGGLITQSIQIIVSLPYNSIDPWYVLVGLFITAYFFEKFRIINNEMSKLNKTILQISKINNKNTEETTINQADVITKLNEKADSIMKLLIEINSAADIFKSTGLRSKKIRRESFSESYDAEEVFSFSETNDKEISTTPEKKSVDESVASTDEIIDDQNISQIDLARALIASNEIEDARNLLTRIVETGNEDHKHEARLLFMQIK